MPGLVIAAEISLRTTASKRLPVQLKLFIQLVGNARGTASSAVLRDAYPGRMFDDSAPIEARELRWDSAYEMPCAGSAREKIGHVFGTCWTFCWTFYSTSNRPITSINT